jgi:MFS family permease
MPHYRRNFIVNMLDGAVFELGMSFVSTTTILPVYVSHLTSSQLLIGLVSAIAELGWFLPQIFTAPFVEGMSRKKPLVVGLGAIERLPYLLMAIGVWVLAGAPADVVLIVFFVLLTARALSSGLVGTAWQDLIAKVIPVRRRGRFFAATNMFGGVLGVGSAIVVERILHELPYPNSFALCFLLGFVAVAISWVFLTMTIEQAEVPELRDRSGLAYWRRLPRILRDDLNFSRFLAAMALSYLGWMASGFLAVYAIGQFHLGDEQAAVFTAILLASSTVSNIVWGYVGDRWGHRLVLIVAGAFAVLGLALAIVANSLEAFYGVFVLSGVASAGLILADLSIILEFSSPTDRPTYIGLTRSLLAPFIGFAPLIGGWVASLIGYRGMFAVALAFTAAGAATLAWLVEEPRRRAP